MGHSEIIAPRAFYEAGFSGSALKHAECGMEHVMRSKQGIQCGIQEATAWELPTVLLAKNETETIEAADPWLVSI